MLQPVQRRIERPLRDLQRVLRDLLDAQQDTLAVQRPERHSFQDQHVEGALQDVDLFAHMAPLAILGMFS
jgi:hypothetical protein